MCTSTVKWFLLMAFSGWTAGEVVGAKRPGHIGDVMLGRENRSSLVPLLCGFRAVRFLTGFFGR